MALLPPVNECVFHYTALDTALEHIFPTDTLLLSGLQGLNDPRESKRRRLVIISGDDVPESGAKYKIWEAYERIFHEQSWVLSTCLDSEPPLSRPGYGSNEIGRGFAIGSMWAHYGQNHRGICLALDRKELTTIGAEMAKEGDIFAAANIKYEDAPDDLINASRFEYWNLASDIESTLLEHVRRYRNFLFFSKNRDWGSEREFRLLLISPSIEIRPQIQLSKVLKGVFLGEDFSPSYLPSIRELVPDSVGIHKLKWDQGVPKLTTVRKSSANSA